MVPSTVTRVEQTLSQVLTDLATPPCPPLLSRAFRHAVFPGGQRVRPRLCIAVAEACGDPYPNLANAAAAALELVHCASLVHDDLPCFDDAATRRGRPTIHREYGEPIAILVGDGLIVRAFDVLAQAGETHPKAAIQLSRVLARGIGAPHGLVAGQAWESERSVDLVAYHRAKTAALFESAAQAGAIAGGGEAQAWEGIGTRLGVAWQVADDLADVLASPQQIGKPVGQDRVRGRPSAVESMGVDGAKAHLRRLCDGITDSVPECSGRNGFQRWLTAVSAKLAGGRVTSDQNNMAAGL